MIKNTSLETLKAQIDIVDIISNSIELKKAGANFKANCPFHEEKSGSFVVSPSKQICHCFGCGYGTDAIGFIQDYKKLEFIEAVEYIANDMNFTLEYDSNIEQKDYSKLMEHINSFYLNHLSKDILEYLHERGITDESIKTFEIGFAPSSDLQLETLRKHLFNMMDAQECGVVAMGEDSKTYARLTKRISFPIRNHTGKLIGFGGRILQGDTRGAKYINSPQTKLFDKSRNLYGYNIAKEHIYKKGTFVVTEGYLDVVMFHQAGIQTAVATMGTALTELHCNIIKKAQAKALLCFDGDKAGLAAAFKASKLLAAHDIHGGVVVFPEGKDPADMVKDGNKEELYEIMSKSVPLIKYAISHIARTYNLHVPQQKQEALQEVQQFLKMLSPLIQDEYKPYIAQVLSINQNHIVTAITNDDYQPVLVANTPFINVGEMNIIKTASEDDEMFSLVLDYIDTPMFSLHQKEFEMLKAKDKALQGLLLRDELSVYTENELTIQLKMILIKHHEKQIVAISNSQDNYDTKSFEIKRVKGVIFGLKKDLSKRGEIV